MIVREVDEKDRCSGDYDKYYCLGIGKELPNPESRIPAIIFKKIACVPTLKAGIIKTGLRF